MMVLVAAASGHGVLGAPDQVGTSIASTLQVRKLRLR